MKKNELRGLGDALAVATGVGIEVVCLIAVGTMLGRGIDVLFGSSPWGTVLGVIAGFAIAMRSIYRKIMKIQS